MRIWQLPPHHPRFRDLAFLDWPTRCQVAGPRLTLADYAPVWEEPDPPAVDPGYLEDCFRRFNAHHPPGYRGRSLSVSDVVEAGGRFYYCDAIGFVDITAITDHTHSTPRFPQEVGPMSLGTTLRDARRARGWTRRQLAEAVALHLGRPLTAQFLADLEADRRTAAPATLAALARALDLDCAWLHWQAGALPRALLEPPGRPVATPDALAAARAAFQAAAPASPDPGGPLPSTREVLAALRAHPTESAFTGWLHTHGYGACRPVAVPILVPLADGLLGVDAIPCRDGLVLAGYDAIDPDAGYEQYRPDAVAALPPDALALHAALVGLSRALAAACAQALAPALGPLADPVSAPGGVPCSTAPPSTTP